MLGQKALAADNIQTIVNCSVANEPFHSQVGFVLEGSMMVLQHSGPKKVAALTESS